jgi:hypothetical protein
MSDIEISKLKCRLTTRNNPYFILSPIKEEEASHKPKILIFHDVMNDAEIATIKKLATPRVLASFILFFDSLIHTFAAVQTSHRAELQDGRAGDCQLPHQQIGLAENRGASPRGIGQQAGGGIHWTHGRNG